MQLATKNFSGLIQEWAAVCQSSIATVRPGTILSFTKGAVLRAIAEAQASVALWLQGLILKLLTTVYLTTSVGPDKDTWIAQFGLKRLPAQGATGLVTVGRATPTNAAVVLIGTLVQSADGTATYQVYADTTNSAYSVNAGGVGVAGYTIPAAVATLNVPVSFIFPANYVAGTYTGTVGNVQANGITILQTGISGVDTVFNAAPFTNGFLAQPDSAIGPYFVAFINSLRAGTVGALTFAAQSVQQGIQVQFLLSQDTNLQTDYGMITMYVDDGSGAIPSATLTSITNECMIVRSAGDRLGVYAATILPAAIVMDIATAPGYYHPTVVAQVEAAIASFVNGLGLGNTLSYMQIAQVAFNASPGVTDVTNYTLNTFQTDLIPAAGQTIKISSISVT